MENASSRGEKITSAPGTPRPTTKWQDWQRGGPLLTLALSPDGQRIVSTDAAGTILITTRPMAPSCGVSQTSIPLPPRARPQVLPPFSALANRVDPEGTRRDSPRL